MITINNNKKVFLVGKNILNTLINPVELTKTISYTNPKCISCPFYKKNNKYAKDYCENFCKDRLLTTTVYKNSNISLYRPYKFKKITFNINSLRTFKLLKLSYRKTTYITTLQSKVMLSYYYLSNNKGIINSISSNQLAKFIGCSSKSIVNCNKVLSKYNLISYQVNDKNDMTIIIKNYSQQFAEKSNGGNGYIVLANSLFRNILKIKKLHEMRLILKTLLLHDSNSNFGNVTTLSLDKLKNFLPKYKQKLSSLKHFKESILQLLNSEFGIIAEPYMKSNMKLDIDTDFNGKALRTDLKNEYKNLFTQTLTDRNFPINDLDTKATLYSNLSLEYDYNLVLNVVTDTPLDILLKNVNQLGAFTRYFLEQPLKWKSFTLAN